MCDEKRSFIIHYYLADDTVEVREIHEKNDGRDPFPVLMKRQHLPKTLVDKKSKSLCLCVYPFRSAGISSVLVCTGECI